MNSKQAFFFGTDKGGVGKTEVAMQTIFSLDEAGLSPKVAEVDSVRRLSMIMPSKVNASIEVTADLLGRLEDDGSARTFFAPLLSVLSQDDGGSAVVDLGATVSGQVLDWIDAMDVGEEMEEGGFRPVFVGVTAPESSSLSGAVRYIRRAQEICGDQADYVLALNDLTGSGFAFLDRDGEAKTALEKLGHRFSVQRITIPHAKRTKLISIARRAGWGIHEAWQLANDLHIAVKNSAPLNEQQKFLFAELGLDVLGTKPERTLALKFEVRAAQKWLLEARVAVGRMIATRDPDPEPQQEAA